MAKEGKVSFLHSSQWINKKKKLEIIKKNLRSKSWVVKWIVNTSDGGLFIYGFNGDFNNRTIVLLWWRNEPKLQTRFNFFFFYAHILPSRTYYSSSLSSVCLKHGNLARAWAWWLYELVMCVFSIHEKWTIHRIREHITRAIVIHKLATLFFPVLLPTPARISTTCSPSVQYRRETQRKKRSIVDLIKLRKKIIAVCGVLGCCECKLL